MYNLLKYKIIQNTSHPQFTECQFAQCHPFLLLYFVRDAFGMRSGCYTNIIQTVRNCYKMKSDSRVLLSGFLCFVCRRKPFLSSILPLLPCQCTPFALQMYPFYIPIVLHLKRKSTVNGVQLYSFCCKIESFQRNSFMRIETDSYVTCCVLTL